MPHPSRQRGFTLIELLVAVAIIGLLAGAAVGYYRSAQLRTNESILREQLFQMRQQIELYFRANGQYPFDLEQLVEEGFLREIPRDPIAGSRETWILVPVLASDLDLFWEPGIEDVQSGADGDGSNGIPYSDW